jgi:hypothetical protein
MKHTFVILLLLLSHIAAPDATAAQCFSLYSEKGILVYQSTESIIDQSRSISEQIAVSNPGHHLVVSPTSYCPELDQRVSTLARAKSLDGSKRSTHESPVLALADDSSSYPGISYLSSAGRGAQYGGPRTVTVKAYTRQDGTQVRGHTRSAPTRGGGGRR